MSKRSFPSNSPESKKARVDPYEPPTPIMMAFLNAQQANRDARQAMAALETELMEDMQYLAPKKRLDELRADVDKRHSAALAEANRELEKAQDQVKLAQQALEEVQQAQREDRREERERLEKLINRRTTGRRQVLNQVLMDTNKALAAASKNLVAGASGCPSVRVGPDVYEVKSTKPGSMTLKALVQLLGQEEGQALWDNRPYTNKLGKKLT